MADCKTCKEKRRELEPVPLIVHESAMARAERHIRQLWIALIILILLFTGTNVAWIIYESQWEVVEETESTEVYQDVETGIGDAVVAGIGDIRYGESTTDSSDY